MGRRDFRHHEPKKPRKGAKKVTTTLTPPVNVEVVPKRQKPPEEA